MDEVITFNKSFQERLNEYKDLLSIHEKLAISEIKKVWSYNIELSIDPAGWQAVWKICRNTCEALKLPFPTIALVYVEDLNSDELTATVKILATQEKDVLLPERFEAPLIHLYPTKEQADTVVLNMRTTSNILDIVRFFYNSLLMPWDDNDLITVWVGKYLEPRLRLCYDMTNGVINRNVAEYCKSLFIECKHLHSKIEQLESELDCEDYDINDENIEDKRVLELMELHVRAIRLKAEIEIVENPLMRKIIFKEHKEFYANQSNLSPTYWLVTDAYSASDYIEFLEKVKNIYPTQTFNISSQLKLVLNNNNTLNNIILNKGDHKLKISGILSNGGVIKGMYNKEDTNITSTAENVTFELGGDVLIENVTIHTEGYCAIVANKGNITLKNCKITGNKHGIIVLNGSELNLIDTEISGFSTAIIGNSGSKLNFDGVNVHHVDFGLKMHDNCNLFAVKSTFSNCSEYGFLVKIGKVNSKQTHHDQEGKIDILRTLPDIKIEDVKVGGNLKGDVSITYIKNIKPLKDLFTSESFEDMETSDESVNTTVIENV